MNRDSRVDDLSWWIETGARELYTRVKAGRPVDLRTWSSAMRALEHERLHHTRADELRSRGYGVKEIEAELAQRRQPAQALRWVWSTIVGNPFWGNEIRDLVRSPDGGDGPIELFPAGTLLVILLKPALKSGGGKSALADWKNQCALVRLLEPLSLRVVKRGRLECAPVACDLWLFVQADRNLEQEKNRLRLSDNASVEVGLEVEVIDRDRGKTERSRCIVVRARSLNQAFGMASGRFESHRMSHGGRIYEHVYHLRENRCVSLDRIRDEVELAGRSAEEAVRTAAARAIDVPQLEYLLRAVELHPRYRLAPSSQTAAASPMQPSAVGISTDDIRRGMMVELRSGRVVEVVDNRRGNVRRVRSDEWGAPEAGDMYAWEFARVEIGPDSWRPVELTADQVALARSVRDTGM